MKLRNYQNGSVSGATIGMVMLGIAVLILVGLSIFLYFQYSEQKSNVDSKIDKAVAVAKKDQSDEDEKKFAEREKEPNRQFVGPDDYGRLTFSYPKTWSTYVATPTTGGGDAFRAYLHPVFVPMVDSKERFALRVVIDGTQFDRTVAQYESLVKKGDLKSSQFSANGQSGTRLDGNFTKDLRGSVVIFKIRDKTVSIFTDADTFKPDFENIVKSVKFND